MSGDRTITIKIVGDASNAKKAFGDAGQGVDEFTGKIEGAGSKLGTFASVAGGIVAAGAVSKIGGFLKDAAQAAADDAASTERLKVAVENSGTSWDSMAKQMDAAIKKGQDLAFSDDDTRAALTALTQETGSSEEALKRLSVAQDLSRGTGMSLEQAAKLLGKTSDENTNTLKKYGITVKDGATAQDLMNEVDKRFGGQAAAFAESGAGQWAKLQDKLGEVQEAIGYMVLPAMLAVVGVVTKVVDGLQPLISILSEHAKPALIALATALTVIVIPAFIAWAGAAAAAAVATVVALAPVIAIAAAIGIAVALLYEAWSTNFLGIQDITRTVIDFIKPYISDAIAAIQVAVTTALDAIKTAWDTVWPLIQATIETVWPIIQTIITTALDVIGAYISTELGIIQGVWDTVWPAIQTTAETVWAAIQVAVNIINDIYNLIASVLGQIQSAWDSIWGAISGAFSGIWDTISGAATSGMGTVKDAISSVLGQIQSIWDSIWGAMSGTVTSIIDTVVSAWNGVAGAINSAIGVWNGLSMSFDTHIPGLGTIHWDSPDLPYLPTIGGGGGGQLYNGMPMAQDFSQIPNPPPPTNGGVVPYPGNLNPSPPLVGGTPIPLPPNTPPTHGPTQPQPPDIGDHTHTRPPGAPPPTVGEPAYQPLNPLYTLPGNPSHGNLGGGGGGRVHAVIAAGLISQGVDPATAVAAATEVVSNPLPSGGSGGGMAGHWSGDVAYSHVTSDYLNPRTRLHQFAGIPAGGGVFLDGFLVGKFLGFRHRREAFSLRDPAGACS